MSVGVVFLLLFIAGCLMAAGLAYSSPSPTEKEEPEEREIVKPVEDALVPQLTESYLTLANYIGQEKVIEYIKYHVRSAKAKDKPLPHVIFFGNGGLGKSTLAKAIAHEMGGRFIELVPSNLKSTKELFTVFFKKQCRSCTIDNPYSANKCLNCREPIDVDFVPLLQLQNADIVFLEECHRLKPDVEEAMYSLMQDGYMIMRFNGVDQRIEFPNITIAGATTLLGDLNKPFRDRFKISIRLEPYKIENMMRIIDMYCKHKELTISEPALKRVAEISHGTPRIAKKYVDDISTVSENIGMDETDIILNLLGVDKFGLDKVHRRIMAFILLRMKSSKNGGAGATAIATSLSLKLVDYMEFYEPGLMYQNFIFQGSRGRRLREKALDEYFPNEKEGIK